MEALHEKSTVVWVYLIVEYFRDRNCSMGLHKSDGVDFTLYLEAAAMLANDGASFIRDPSGLTSYGTANAGRSHEVEGGLSIPVQSPDDLASVLAPLVCLCLVGK